MVFCGEVETGRSLLTESLTVTTATATKTSLENKHLGNGDYFVIIGSSSPPLSQTTHAANGLVEAPLK